MHTVSDEFVCENEPLLFKPPVDRLALEVALPARAAVVLYDEAVQAGQPGTIQLYQVEQATRQQCTRAKIKTSLTSLRNRR